MSVLIILCMVVNLVGRVVIGVMVVFFCVFWIGLLGCFVFVGWVGWVLFILVLEEGVFFILVGGDGGDYFSVMD